MFCIATNLARNHFRSEARRRRAYGEVRASARAPADSPPEAELLSRETGALVEGIVWRLPLNQRLAFTQRKIHVLDYEAIGRSLGCSPESARAHVFQSLRKIRQALDGHGLLPGEPQRSPTRRPYAPGSRTTSWLRPWARRRRARRGTWSAT